MEFRGTPAVRARAVAFYNRDYSEFHMQQHAIRKDVVRRLGRGIEAIPNVISNCSIDREERGINDELRSKRKKKERRYGEITR